MFLSAPVRLPVESGSIDALLSTVPDEPAVFLLWPPQGEPYLGKTSLLRRRLRRLLGERSGPSRLLSLRRVTHSIEYWTTHSSLASALAHYAVAREHFPSTYLKLLKLRFPTYVKLIQTNLFPRCQVTHRLSDAAAVYYGPFRSRGAAEHFESELLDLFLLRRCQEDLVPSPAHPGCLYGEIGRCLRPCQAVVTPAGYAAEAGRVEAFLRSQGEAALKEAESARDQASEELAFEEAARQHQRYERIRGVLSLRDELVQDIDQLHGVCLMPPNTAGEIELQVIYGGCWQAPLLMPAGVSATKVEEDLQQEFARRQNRCGTAERQEHLALLARWFYSSFREGRWLPLTDAGKSERRKLARTIERAAAAALPSH